MLDVIAVHLSTACNLFVCLIVNEHSCEIVARLTVGARSHSVGHTDGMFVVQHIVESKFSGQHLVLVVIAHHAVLLIVTLQVGVLSAVIGLTATTVLVFGHTEDVKSACAVVQVQFLQAIDVVVHARHRAAVETEALTDGTDGLDANDSFDGSVVFCTRCHYDLHVFDLVAAKLVEFALVAHLPSVDVDKRSATAYNLYAVAITNNSREVGKHIITCANLRKKTTLNDSDKSIIAHPEKRSFTFYCHSFQCLCFWPHVYCSEFCIVAILVNGLITNKGNANENRTILTGDDKEASLVTYASTYES